MNTVPSGPALAQIRESAQALLAQGKVDETWEFFLAALDAVLMKNRELELLVLKLRRERLGRHTERLDPRQIALLFDALLAQGATPEPLDPDAEVREDAALDREITDAEQRGAGTTRSRRKPRKADPGWRTTGVERHVHVIEVSPEDQTCPTCHNPMRCLGVDVTRRLQYVPGHFVEEESHRQKWACPRCKEAVITAPAPPQVLPRSAADASLLAHIVVSKFADHTPLHRVHRIYARSGADIPVSTLADWVAGVGTRVEPLVERLAVRVRAAYIVRTDATGLKVLDPRSPDHVEMGSIWAYVGDDHDVLFRYTPTGEGATGPWTFLAGRTGYVHASRCRDRLRSTVHRTSRPGRGGRLSRAWKTKADRPSGDGLPRGLSPETPRARLSDRAPRGCARTGARRPCRTATRSDGAGHGETASMVWTHARAGIAGHRPRQGGGVFRESLVGPHAVSRGRPPRSR